MRRMLGSSETACCASRTWRWKGRELQLRSASEKLLKGAPAGAPACGLDYTLSRLPTYLFPPFPQAPCKLPMSALQGCIFSQARPFISPPLHKIGLSWLSHFLQVLTLHASKTAYTTAYVRRGPAEVIGWQQGIFLCMAHLTGTNGSN